MTCPAIIEKIELKCDDCEYCYNCPCGHSWNNAACLTIKRKALWRIAEEVFRDSENKVERISNDVPEAKQGKRKRFIKADKRIQ